MYMAAKGGNLIPVANALQKGSAKPFTGNSNPQLSGDIRPGDIVVIGRIFHPEGGESVQYRVFNDTDNSYTDYAETYEFVEIARREADAEVVSADFSLVGGATPQLQAAFDRLKTNLMTIIGRLEALPAGSYYNVAYRDAAGIARSQRIRVAELLSWFRLVDFTVFPESTDWGNGGVGGTIITNAGRLIMQDVELQVKISNFLTFGGTNGGSLWYLIHEVGHATQFGQRLYTNFTNGTPLERNINKLALDIVNSIGLSFGVFTPGDLTSSPDRVYDADLSATLVEATL